MSLVGQGSHSASGVSSAILADASTPAVDPASAAAVLVSEAATLALALPSAGAVTPVPASPKVGVVATPPPPAPVVVPVPVVVPAPFVTPVPPFSTWVPPVAVARAPSGSAKAGQATWLDTIPTGTCANNDAPMGTVITVTNLAGSSITCRVVSRGPFITGRIVDVAKATFRTLGTTSQGVVSVAVSW